MSAGKTPPQDLVSIFFRVLGFLVCSFIVAVGVIGIYRSAQDWTLRVTATGNFQEDSANVNFLWAIRALGLILIIFGVTGILAEMRVPIFKRFLGVLDGYISLAVFYILSAFLCVGVAGVVGFAAFICCLVNGVIQVILRFAKVPFTTRGKEASDEIQTA